MLLPRAAERFAIMGLLAVAALLLPAAHSPAAPQRVVSLDYCADQFVLELVPRARIVALSTDAEEPFSYHRERARGLPQVRARAEDVLLLRPDLVVGSYGGDQRMDRLLEDAGARVLRVGWVEDLDGVRDNLRAMGEGLGNREGARALLEQFDRRLARATPRPAQRERRALYVTPGGVTSGTDTLVHELLRAAGLANFSQRRGWQPLPLERLAYETPDVLVTSRFVEDQHPWSAARHPLLRERLASLPTVNLPGAWTACGGWFLIDAIEAMAALAR